MSRTRKAQTGMCSFDAQALQQLGRVTVWPARPVAWAAFEHRSHSMSSEPMAAPTAAAAQALYTKAW